MAQINNDDLTPIEDFNIGGNNNNAIDIDSFEPEEEEEESNDDTSIKGLSDIEINDHNSINVTIADNKTPIVVLYGPPSCGKTMTLVRLTRYLTSQGYTVQPVKTFRPSYDSHYRRMCDEFNQMINSNDAAASTKHISFMLVKVLMNGHPVCQILEAPGELYFNPNDPTSPYPAYVHGIIANNNRKIWAVMVEPDWNDEEQRANYVTRIAGLKRMMTTRDKVLFVFNKIDLTPHVKGQGQVDIAEAIRDITNQFPNIFVPFRNVHPITSLWRKYNCEFVPFMTGTYVKKSSGIAYIQGHETYARRLWKAMLKLIRG